MNIAAKKLWRKLMVPLIALFAGWAGLCSFAYGAKPDSLTMGVHPYLGAAELTRRFTPLADILQSRLGIPVQLKIGGSYEEHIEAIASGKVDIAFMGPALYVKLVHRHGPQPLLAKLERHGSTLLSGHIVVTANSPIRRLDQLRHKVFAFGDPDSTMSTLMPQAVLEQAGISLDQLAAYRHYGNHRNVAIAVLSAQADAGAVKAEVYQAFRKKGLRSLLELPRVSEHVFVARSGLDEEIQQQLRSVLLGLRYSAEGMSALKSLHKGATGLVRAKDSDYESLRDVLYGAGEGD